MIPIPFLNLPFGRRYNCQRFTQCSTSFYLLYLFLATAWSAPFVETMDVEIDWSPESNLFNKGSLTTTKFVRIGDKVVFQCPPNLWLAIHRVTRQSLFNCDLSHVNDTLVGYCRPDQTRFTFVVRDFSLLPNAKIFRPNEYYFFTSTSNGTKDGLENRVGGFCRSHDMRLRLKVGAKNASIDEYHRPADLINLILPDGISDSKEHRWKNSQENDPKHNSISTRHLPSKHKPEHGAEGFPAVVTFQDNGREIKILVETYEELKEKLDEYLIRRGNRPIGGVRVEPMNPPKPPDVHRKSLPEYEVSQHGNKVERRHDDSSEEHHFVTMGPEAASLSKRKNMLRPHDQNEKDYEIGYDVENGSPNLYLTYGFWLCAVANLTILLLSRTALRELY